jgi:GTPase Era involved in 16S rRNA processing
MAMSTISISNTVLKATLRLLPGCAEKIARFDALLSGKRPPVVTVIGKYNHGKSLLLNVLIGSEVFEVADKRQTVELKSYDQDGIRWLDAPGLDADVTSEDDRKALRAARLESDIRLFVHAAKEGELDKNERDWLDELRADDAATQRQTLFVLSRIDAVDDEELRQITREISKQMSTPAMVIYGISSPRYHKGLKEGKKMFLEKSGIPSLAAALKQSLDQVSQAREQEILSVGDQIQYELAEEKRKQERTLSALREKRNRLREFMTGLESTLSTMRHQLEV